MKVNSQLELKMEKGLKFLMVLGLECAQLMLGNGIRVGGRLNTRKDFELLIHIRAD